MLTIGRALAAAIGLIAALAAVNAGSGQEGQGVRPPASFFGGGLEPGALLWLYVDGVECGQYEVQDNGQWAFHVHEGDCGGAAADGAEVSFAIGADAANETFAWRAGFAPHDLRNGIRLTVGGGGAPAPGGEAGIGVGGVRPGAAIRMLVDGAVCASGEPGQSGRWTFLLGAGQCGARDGSRITFVEDFGGRTRIANEDVAWANSFALEAIRIGVQLTFAARPTPTPPPPASTPTPAPTPAPAEPPEATPAPSAETPGATPAPAAGTTPTAGRRLLRKLR